MQCTTAVKTTFCPHMMPVWGFQAKCCAATGVSSKLCPESSCTIVALQLNRQFGSGCLLIVFCDNVQDANLSPDRLRMAYTEMVLIVRKLYQDCRLVHGDLSEYNILFHEVSQLLFIRTTCRI